MDDLLDPKEIQNYIDQGLTHAQISEILQEQYPGHRGLSTRSVRRYCAKEDIHWTPVTDGELREAVQQGVEQVNVMNCSTNQFQ